MSAVSGSVGGILTGQVRPDFANSWNAFANWFAFIQGAPWHQRTDGSCGCSSTCTVIVTARHRRDPALLAVTLLPLVLCVVGYALFVGHVLEAYYYLMLMPAAVLTVRPRTDGDAVPGRSLAPSPYVSQ